MNNWKPLHKWNTFKSLLIATPLKCFLLNDLCWGWNSLNMYPIFSEFEHYNCIPCLLCLLPTLMEERGWHSRGIKGQWKGPIGHEYFMAACISCSSVSLFNSHFQMYLQCIVTVPYDPYCIAAPKIHRNKTQTLNIILYYTWKHELRYITHSAKLQMQLAINIATRQHVSEMCQP